MRSLFPLIPVLLLAACQSAGAPETSIQPLPKGTALPPPEHDVLPGAAEPEHKS